jgi:hypothetical protein
MKNLKSVLGIGVIAVAGFFAIAADHIEAPAVKGGTSDITDFYAFQGQNTDNMVFVAKYNNYINKYLHVYRVFNGIKTAFCRCT